MASRIQGITVEFGGDTTKFSKTLEGVKKSIKGTQFGLKDEATGIQKIILAVGYTNLRKGVDSLAQLVGTNREYDLNPFEKDVLFLFCGRRTDRIKS